MASFYIALVYFATGFLGQMLAISPGNVTPLWPPSGIALAAIILLGRRSWAGIVIGAVLVNGQAILRLGPEHISIAFVITSLLIGLGSLLQPVVGQRLLSLTSTRSVIDSPYSFIKFFGLTPIFCLVSASVGTLSLYLGGLLALEQFTETWMTWWLGDSVGVLLFYPIIYLCFRSGSDIRISFKSFLYLASMLFITMLSFGILFDIDAHYPIAFLPVPFLILLALKESLFVTQLAVLVTSLTATFMTSSGFGPFYVGETNISLLLVQSFIAVSVVTASVVMIGIEKQNKTQRELDQLNDSLMKQVKERTRELEIEKEKAEQVAKFDPLTNIYNRRAFYEEYDKLKQLAVRQEVSLALLVIDIDHFKRVNDRYGHERGDAVIKTVAERIKSQTRETDIFARFGGEEFVIAMFDADDKQAYVYAERIRMHIDHYDELAITISIGVASVSNIEDIQFIKLFSKADKALYEAKNSGRNRCCVA